MDDAAPVPIEGPEMPAPLRLPRELMAEPAAVEGAPPRVFVEVVGRRALPDDVDRDDVEDLVAGVLGPDGEITGAGGGASGWNLDIEVDPARATELVRLIAAALVEQDLGWVTLRSEDEATGRAAAEMAGQ
ncbi:hypothetical protein [Paractinoplanes lichenicola]|uniref:Uncharacterized protein n=1 Tax=Paractinoplanes lichenicola TaxID=2802976 RepID=A0ABS1VDP5_9ACTN|nr:hypothetical protein [Actinoplanes lichenicola]MBL7252797.1 hypothetical protein [Actinoplanes lichenicola]